MKTRIPKGGGRNGIHSNDQRIKSEPSTPPSGALAARTRLRSTPQKGLLLTERCAGRNRKRPEVERVVAE